MRFIPDPIEEDAFKSYREEKGTPWAACGLLNIFRLLYFIPW
jgi:hypothetical protein